MQINLYKFFEKSANTGNRTSGFWGLEKKMNDVLIKQGEYEAVLVGRNRYVIVDYRGALMCPCCIDVEHLVSVMDDAIFVWPEWGTDTAWHKIWKKVPVVFVQKVCGEHPYAACKGKEVWRTLFRERLVNPSSKG